MEDSRFFRTVWRFNAIVIMATGIIAIAFLVFACLMVYKELGRDRSVRNIVNIEEAAGESELWELGRITDVQGSSVIMLPLHSEQSYSRGSYNKSTSSVRNYLFMDTLNNEKHWLLSHNNYLITNAEQLPGEQYGEDPKDAAAIIYKIIKSDTSGDGLLTESDLQTLALSKADGALFTEFAKDIDHLVGYKTTNSNSVLVIFQRDKVGYFLTVDLSTFEVSNEGQLPNVQP